MPIRTTIAVVSLLGILLFYNAGCYSSGPQITPQQVSSIQRGVTTEADLVKMWGEPFSSHTTMNGNKELDWAHVDENITGTFIPFAPQNSQAHGVIVTVDKDGIVTDYRESETTQKY